MFVLGLTGSIGMGKSTVATMLTAAGVPVLDADATVHALYSVGGAAVEPVGALFPTAIVDGAIDRGALSACVVGKPDALASLERVVHPLVAAERRAWLAAREAEGARFVALDVPLLYETGGEAGVDAVAVVSAPANVQRARVLARPGMTQAKLAAVLARQVPDADKRGRADFVVETGVSLDETRGAVRALVAALDGRQGQGRWRNG